MSESESDGLEDFVVGDGQEDSSSSSGSGSGSGSEVEDAMTLYRRQQNEELVVPADESSFFEAMQDERQCSRLCNWRNIFTPCSYNYCI